MKILEKFDPIEWNKIISSLPQAQGHILQTWQWGNVKAQYGWSQHYALWYDETNIIQAAALILSRSVTLAGFGAGIKVLYVPKGPILDWQDDDLVKRVLVDLQDYAREQSAIFIKIDPDVIMGWGIPGEEDAHEDLNGQKIRQDLLASKWVMSQDQIQFRNTVLLDLTQDETTLLTKMKQKTRYNIRLGPKRGLTVRTGTIEDLDLLFEMYAQTSIRDGFVIRSSEYYKTVWETFMKDGLAEPLIAEIDGEAVAAVFIFHFAGVSRYLYGMSRETHRDKMPNHTLQWEAIKRSKVLECHTYDMWGAPDEFNENDSLWGVYRFKEGFSGIVLRTLGAWDYPARPFLYKLYTRILPRILNLMRKKGKAETQEGLQI